MNAHNNNYAKLLAWLMAVVFFLQSTFVYAEPNSSFVVRNLPLARPANNMFIPEQYGKINKAQIAGYKSQVFLIKDAHCVYEAQKNIEKILEVLIRDYKIDLVCVEGASGNVDTSVFQSMPYKEARKKACGTVMQKGYLSASEALSICMANELPFTVWGVEDQKLYVNDLKLFRDTMRDSETGLVFIGLCGDIINKLKDKLYNPELKKFDEQRMKYERNEMELTEWVKYLKAMLDTRLSILDGKKNFVLVLRAVNLEKLIDFKKVEIERSELIKELEKRLVKEDMQELVKKSLLFKMGKIPSLEYYTYLEGHKEFKLDCFANFNKYIHLLKLQSKIDENGLFGELKKVESEAVKGLFKSRAEEDLYNMDKSIHILSKLFRLQMSRSELSYYSAHKAEFFVKNMADLLVVLANENNIEIPAELRDSLFLGKAQEQAMPAEDFYKLAKERDEVLVDNLLNKMKKDNKEKAIIVAGGFHAEGIEEELKSLAVSTVTITPAITKIQEDNPYLKLMADVGADLDAIIPKNIALPLLFGAGAENIPAYRQALHLLASEQFKGYKLDEVLQSITDDKQRECFRQLANLAGVETIDELRKAIKPETIVGYIKRLTPEEISAMGGDAFIDYLFYVLQLLCDMNNINYEKFVSSQGLKTRPRISALPQEEVSFLHGLMECPLAGRATLFEEWVDDVLGQTDRILNDKELEEIAGILRIDPIFAEKIQKQTENRAQLALSFSNGLPDDGKYNIFFMRDSFALYSAARILGKPADRMYLSKTTFNTFAGEKSIGSVYLHFVIYEAKARMGLDRDAVVPAERFEEFRRLYVAVFGDLLRGVNQKGFTEEGLFQGRDIILKARENVLQYLKTVLGDEGWNNLDKNGIRFIDTTVTGSLVLFMEAVVYYELRGRGVPEEIINEKIDGRMFYSKLSPAFSFAETIEDGRAVESAFYPIVHGIYEGAKISHGNVPMVEEFKGHDKARFLYQMILLRNRLLALKNEYVKISAPAEGQAPQGMDRAEDIDAKEYAKARQLTTEVKVEGGDRAVELRILNNILSKIHPEDMDEIKKMLASNYKTEIDNRSKVYRLKHPIYMDEYGEAIVSLQLKGIVFTADGQYSEHMGAGWSPYFVRFDASGKAVKISNVPNIQGGMKKTDAVHEFLMCEELGSNMNLNGRLQVKHPVGFGVFPGVEANGLQFGFVIEGMKTNKEERGYVDGSFENYGRTLRFLHDQGIRHQRLHPGNISYDGKGLPVVHDLESCFDISDSNEYQRIGYMFYDVWYGMMQVMERPEGKVLPNVIKKGYDFLKGYFGRSYKVELMDMQLLIDTINKLVDQSEKYSIEDYIVQGNRLIEVFRKIAQGEKLFPDVFPRVGSTGEGEPVNEAILRAYTGLQFSRVKIRHAAKTIIDALRGMTEPEYIVNLMTALGILRKANDPAYAPIIRILEKYAVLSNHSGLLAEIQEELSKIPTMTEMEKIETLFEESGEEMILDAGATLFNYGEPSADIYFITEGTLSVVEKNVDLGRGNIIGEIGVLDASRPRTATVTAKTRAKLLKINARKFRKIINRPANRGIKKYLQDIAKARKQAWPKIRIQDKDVPLINIGQGYVSLINDILQDDRTRDEIYRLAGVTGGNIEIEDVQFAGRGSIKYVVALRVRVNGELKIIGIRFYESKLFRSFSKADQEAKEEVRQFKEFNKTDGTAIRIYNYFSASEWFGDNNPHFSSFLEAGVAGFSVGEYVPFRLSQLQPYDTGITPANYSDIISTIVRAWLLRQRADFSEEIKGPVILDLKLENFAIDDPSASGQMIKYIDLGALQFVNFVTFTYLLVQFVQDILLPNSNVSPEVIYQGFEDAILKYAMERIMNGKDEEGRDLENDNKIERLNVLKSLIVSSTPSAPELENIFHNIVVKLGSYIEEIQKRAVAHMEEMRPGQAGERAEVEDVPQTVHGKYSEDLFKIVKITENGRAKFMQTEIRTLRGLSPKEALKAAEGISAMIRDLPDHRLYLYGIADKLVRAARQGRQYYGEDAFMMFDLSPDGKWRVYSILTFSDTDSLRTLTSWVRTPNRPKQIHISLAGHQLLAYALFDALKKGRNVSTTYMRLTDSAVRQGLSKDLNNKENIQRFLDAHTEGVMKALRNGAVSGAEGADELLKKVGTAEGQMRDKDVSSINNARQLLKDLSDLERFKGLDPVVRDELAGKIAGVLERIESGGEIKENELKAIAYLPLGLNLEEKFELVARIAKFVNSVFPNNGEKAKIIAAIEAAIMEEISKGKMKEEFGEEVDLKEMKLLDIAKKIGEKKGIPPEEIQSIFDLFKQGIDVLTMDPELNPGQIDGSYFTLVEEIAELTGIDSERIKEAFRRQELGGKKFSLSQGKIIEGTGLYKAARRLNAYNTIHKDTQGLVGALPEEARENNKETVVVFDLNLFRDMPLVGLKMMLKQKLGKGDVKLGLMVPDNIDRKKVEEFIAHDYELKDNVVLFSSDIAAAQSELQDKNYVFVVDERFDAAKIPKGVKVFGVGSDAPFYRTFLFGYAYATVSDTDSLRGFLTGLGVSSVDEVLTLMREGKFFTLKLQTTRELLDLFQNRRITLDIAA